jgi:hypothetical protein
MFEDCKVELLETFGNDLTVVNAARVSLGKHTTEFTDKDAQAEIRVVAGQVSELIKTKFPVSWGTLVRSE